MASDDDSVLRNHYNNNETVAPSSSPTSGAGLAVSLSTASNNPSAPRNSSSRYPGTGFTVGGSESRSPRMPNTDGHTTETQPRREENPFSFKHFLNRDTTTSSSTASSLGSSSNCNLQNNSNVTATTSSASHNNQQFKNSPNNNSNPINGEMQESVDLLAGSIPDAIPSSKTSNTVSNSSKPVTVAATAATTPGPYQSSTGARPKVPQSILGGQPQPLPPLQSSSASASSISSLVGEGPKMKRSPRFSSFDSQASLAEFAGGTATSVSGLNLKSDDMIGSGLCDDNPGSSINNFFPNGPDFDRQQYVHRSYSNYDMDGAQSVSPQRSRVSPPGGLPSTNHPSSLILNSPMGRHPNARQPPIKNYHQNPIGSHIHANRPVSEYSAALPDFVQDHWMDNWYCSLEMNINSPPNSPISPVDFVEDLNNPNPADICQTLPDFLSDGPIAHSAARLADVAAGLPGLDSPEENSPSLQLSRVRLENERLRRELDESRLALAEQTRRAGELERRLEQARSNETAYSASLAQSMEQVEENLDQSKKRAAAAQSQMFKLKQQVKQLTAEVNSLRRENESLREDGAVGGDRATRQPSRTQQLSRDLRRAASTAENNLRYSCGSCVFSNMKCYKVLDDPHALELCFSVGEGNSLLTQILYLAGFTNNPHGRQLLTGVENLRLMAATIENMDRLDCNDGNNQANPIINEEYLSDNEVDFDDLSGPAL